MAAKSKQIAIDFAVGLPHLARMLHGITNYAHRHGPWAFSFSPEMSTTATLSWRGWSGDGMIAQINTEAEARMAREMKVPVVNISGVLSYTSLARVMVDQEALGRLAAEHLLDCGFRRFAYYGVRHVWYSQQRQRGFIERLVHDGGECSVLEAPSSLGTRRSWHDWQQPLERWLKTLKTPVGLLATQDPRATMVVDACSRLGLHVPEEVAVIGVSNNETTCEFSQVPLSSVSRSAERVGYEAAALLDRLMSGEQPPDDDILVPPDGVVQRRSTDVVAVEDPHVAVAVRFIREHIDEPFGVEKLLPLVPISRRWLECRFEQCLGRTPHEFICHARVQRARQLLTGPKKLRLHQIAEACGFSDTQRFRIVFRRLTGKTPAEYRRSNQTHE